MKRYIKSSDYWPDNWKLSNVSIEDCIAIAQEILKENNSEMQFYAYHGHLDDRYGILTKYKGKYIEHPFDTSADIIIDDYRGDVNSFHFSPYGYKSYEQAQNAIPERIDIYLDYFDKKLNKLQQVINRIPECYDLAENISNRIADYYRNKFDNINITYELASYADYDVKHIAFRLNINETDHTRVEDPQFKFNIKIGDIALSMEEGFVALQDGSAYQDIINNINKAIKRSKQGGFNNKYIVSLLNEYGIDTTKHKYELYAEKYGRMSSGSRYKKTFSCPGDWLAYLSMLTHKSPTARTIEDKFGQDYFEELVEENPSIKDINNHASENWWGDGDDYIIYLKNLDTGEYLYGPEEVEDEVEEEEDWED